MRLLWMSLGSWLQSGQLDGASAADARPQKHNRFSFSFRKVVFCNLAAHWNHLGSLTTALPPSQLQRFRSKQSGAWAGPPAGNH